MKKRNPWIRTLFWVLISFVTLFPIYWLFVISATPAMELFSTPDVVLRHVYWQNYIDVLNNPTLRGYMLNSLVISSGNALVCTTFGFFACYALS
ncbi:MAG: carbohydrate ABC transporter permease, partial [Mesorhizobium sp.]